MKLQLFSMRPTRKLRLPKELVTSECSKSKARESVSFPERLTAFILALKATGWRFQVLHPEKAVCLVPQGTDEGQTLDLPSKTYSLRSGQKLTLEFFGTKFRPQDKIGTEVLHADKELEDRFSMSLEIPEEGKEQIPVTLGANISDVGVLEVFLNERDGQRSWNLALDLRNI